MIEVKIDKDVSLDKALKTLKNKFRKMGIVDELRERQSFTKKSVRRRQQKIKAKYKEK